MATILKSNTVVNNPDREFQYYTNRGITDKAMSDFLTGMESVGYDLTDAEYQAVKVFKDKLIAANVWDKIYEVYPLMGDSLESAAVKLKSVKVVKMTPVDGLSMSHMQVRAGKLVGKAATAVPSYVGNFPRYDTNLRPSDLADRYVGFHAYCGNAAEVATPFAQPIMGTLLGRNNESTTLIGTLSVNTASKWAKGEYLGAGIQSTSAYVNTIGLLSAVTKPQSLDISGKASIYHSGVKKEESVITSLVSAASVDMATTFALFGQNKPLGSTAQTTGYSGTVRFGCITNGFMTDEDVATLNTEVVALMTKLGKVAA